MGELATHRRECERAPVKCQNQGCTETPLRKDLPAHEAKCEYRKVPCAHCWNQVAISSLVEHEGCTAAKVECPNEGCCEQCKRGLMNAVHRAMCQQEEVSCLCPGCDARLLRKDMEAHVEATHQASWVKRLQMRAAARLFLDDMASTGSPLLLKTNSF